MQSTKYILTQAEVEILNKISLRITGRLIRENICADEFCIKHSDYLLSLKGNDAIQMKFSLGGYNYDFEAFFEKYVEHDKYNDFEYLLRRISGKPIIAKFEVENIKVIPRENSFKEFVLNFKGAIQYFTGN